VTARQLHRYGGRALARPAARSWPGVEVERVRWQVGEHATGLSCRAEHQLFVTLSGSLRHTSAWIDGGHRYDGADFAGATTFIPSGRHRRSSYCDGVIEYASIRLDPALLESLDVATERLEFAGFTNRPDPMLHRLALALCDEAQHPGQAGRLYVDSVATTMLVHLLRACSNLAPRRLVTGRIPLQGATLRRVLEYVEEHLAEDLRLDVLAGVAGTDRVRFGRAFKAATGVSPHRYVVRRRLDLAARLLRVPDGPPIAEIAYRAGMSSQSHLTTAFRRAYGITPYAYRAAVTPPGAGPATGPGHR
jgi:AraC family transcriptional regulator